jgi:hypothetical protein
VDDSVDDLALEGLEYDGAIARDELGLAVAGDDHALADVRDGDDGDDEAELAGAGALDVGIELGLEVLLHAWPEVGRVEHDRVRELFLREGRVIDACQGAREKERVTMKNIVGVRRGRGRGRSVRPAPCPPMTKTLTRRIPLDFIALLLYSCNRLCFKTLRREQPDVTAASINYAQTTAPSDAPMHSVTNC